MKPFRSVGRCVHCGRPLYPHPANPVLIHGAPIFDGACDRRLFDATRPIRNTGTYEANGGTWAELASEPRLFDPGSTP